MASSYGKRPLWQWVVIYLIVGALVYGLIYYFMSANKGGYTSSPQTQQSPAQEQTPVQQAPDGQPSHAY